MEILSEIRLPGANMWQENIQPKLDYLIRKSSAYKKLGEFASENGTELNTLLPKMSPLNPLYLTKKQRVFQKISAFVDKFKGLGGKL